MSGATSIAKSTSASSALRKSCYLVALGGNRRSRWGSTRRLLARIDLPGLVRRSSIIETAPLGPGSRRYANGAALIETPLDPSALLAALKAIERAHGRRPGRRWGDRVLDLDIIAWSGGIWVSPGLTIPHPAFRTRRFVLDPLAEIAPGWRDPVTGRTARQLAAGLRKKRPRRC